MKWFPFVLLVGVLNGLWMFQGGAAAAADSDWLDKVTQRMLMEQSLAKEGSFAPYLEQIRLVRDAVDKGDAVGTYRSMNRLMALLETDAGGIPRRTAEKLWAYCYDVVPHDLHSEEVHIRAIGKDNYQKMKAHEINERWQSSREQLD
ncbi:MAG: hypothetical protein KGO52_07020 [Nitrospirota bacterium]|nr:hypothetical protein [Nitrospirota bacterium]